jgi:hypothetical protein
MRGFGPAQLFVEWFAAEMHNSRQNALIGTSGD